MKKVLAVFFVSLLPSLSFANLISDGGFDTMQLTPSSDCLDFDSEKLNTWYTYSSETQSFYEVTAQGYVSPAVQDQSGRIFLQIIAAPQIGDYLFSFDYRLSDDSDMFSVVRLFGINDSDASFSVELNSWTPNFNDADNVERLYDQGGYASYLSTAQDWTSVSEQLNLVGAFDFIVIAVSFSYDGTQNSMQTEHADLDNFSITSVPEPATLASLALGFLMLRRRCR